MTALSVWPVGAGRAQQRFHVPEEVAGSQLQPLILLSGYSRIETGWLLSLPNGLFYEEITKDN